MTQKFVNVCKRKKCLKIFKTIEMFDVWYCLEMFENVVNVFRRRKRL